NLSPASFYRGQENSFFDQFNHRIHAFDLRVAYKPSEHHEVHQHLHLERCSAGDDMLGFWHSVALLTPTINLGDVLFGIYG
ncbi:hypothetical protein DL96DRAFT_1469364, partial [Flagelloscypha sp. PMI_526]